MSTKGEYVEHLVARINRKTGRKFSVNSSAGGKRLIEHVGHSGEDDISPRLPIGQLITWLGAFEKGIDVGAISHV